MAVGGDIPEIRKTSAEHPMTDSSGQPDRYAPKPLLTEETKRAIVVNLAKWLTAGEHVVVGVGEAEPELERDPKAGTTVRVRVEGLGVARVFLPRGQRFGSDEMWPWAWELP